MTEQENIVTPVALAKELGIRPQLVFGWVRRGLIPSHKCVCNHTYLLRDEVSDYLEAREKAAAEKAAKVEAELNGKAKAEASTEDEEDLFASA